ncbi:MAG TPA: hypothetical protein VMV60_04080 [Thermoanaerobaculia bacterium]|nr:hypothetical protein [Thermoanaerobaculia bacterium]
MLPWLLLLAVAAAPQAAPLVVTVSPPLDPAGAPWIVQILEESSEGRKPVDGHSVDAEGRWNTSAARRGGLYRLRVSTEAGAGWFADEKPFEWSGSASSAAPREIRLGASALRGTVWLGKKSLRSRVTFTDRDGLVSVPFATEEDGTFEGVLPRDGWWSVTVAADRPHFRTTFDVKVDPIFRDGTPPDVEIRVVSKVIQGEIVDLKNVRLPVASLTIHGVDRNSDSLNVEEGRFTWDRVVDGWMSVQASAYAGPGRLDWSPQKSVRVSGGRVDPGFLTLEIRPTYVLKGRAVLPSGEPAAGVTIRSLSSAFHEELRSAADGRFRMTVRGGGASACLLVLDPSKAARLVSVPASQSEENVPVADRPGTLSLEFTPRGERRIGALVADGCKFSWYWFWRLPEVVEGSQGSTLTARFRVSAGSYALCGLEYGDFDEDAEIPPEACVTGVLPPGGALTLRLNP